MYRNVILTILVLFLVNLTCYAEQSNNSENNNDKVDYIILPIGYYNQSTSFGFGVFSIFLFKENKNQERSMLRKEISYTLKNQIIFRYKSISYFQESKFTMKSNVKKFNSDYYGLGNSSTLDKESYSYFTTELELNYSKNIYNNIFYSFIYDLDIVEILEDDGGALQNDGFYYEDLKFNNSIGFGLNYEKISKKFFRSGLSANFNYIGSTELIGSSNNFSIFNTDIKYFTSYKQSSLNLQLVTKFSFEDVPFSKLSTLGGSNNLRGYPDKRFTDKNMIVFQSEYDFRIYKKYVGSIFYSLGDVFGSFSDLKFNKIKQGYGLGILYELLGTAVRIDVATSPENEIQIIATGSRAF